MNEVLLVNSVLEPDYSGRISFSTALHWVHNLGFDVIKKKKGTLLQKMVANGFLTKKNTPTPEADAALLADLVNPSKEQIEKNIIIFNDESTFQSNDDKTWMLGTQGEHVIKPKSCGAGIMVSDFIEEHNN